MNKVEREAGLPKTPGYRYADLVGHRLYVAGQVPVDAAGNVVDGGVAAQAAQCLANLFTVVGAHDFSRDDIHELTIYVVGDTDTLRAAWSVFTEAFANDVPPATLLGVAALGYDGQLVEISARIERSVATR
jgi:enamine deaminase RidA (YjgF/YER057c/UK114 family)